jgi:hypothetical protein
MNKKDMRIYLRIGTIWKYKDADHIKEIYLNVIGQKMIDALEVMADRHLHEYGFDFKMSPTVKEFQEFKEDLGLMMQEEYYGRSKGRGFFKINAKLATEYLMYHRRKLSKCDKKSR